MFLVLKVEMQLLTIFFINHSPPMAELLTSFFTPVAAQPTLLFPPQGETEGTKFNVYFMKTFPLALWERGLRGEVKIYPALHHNDRKSADFSVTTGHRPACRPPAAGRNFLSL